MRFSAIILSGAAALSADSLKNGGPLHPTPVAKVKIEGGFWGGRVTTNARVTLPHNLAFIENTGRMAAFDRAAGKNVEGMDNPTSVVDSDVHKILEGAAYTLQLRPDDVDVDGLARQVARVIAAQEDDGFLVPRVTVMGRDGRWENLHRSHVLYSAGHLFESGAAWHDATGDHGLLDASTRFADLIDGRFGPGKVHDIPGHQEIELGLLQLHRATGEPRYLDLCRFFLDQRGHIHGEAGRTRGVKTRTADYMQDRVPLAEAEEAVGHTVRATYTYAAMAELAMLVPDHGYDDALDRLWNDVVGRKFYLTGASATAQYHDEGFGDPYVLPNETAYAETCGSIGFVLWAHRMALLRGDANYVDALERSLYNGVLSGISLSGDKYFYKNPLASRGGVRRYASWNPACCQSNLVRVIPQVGSLAYATSGDTAVVNLFVAGQATLQLASGELRLHQETRYPRDGSIRLTVESMPTEPFAIAVRIPGWAREMPVPRDLYRFAETITERPSVTVAGEPHSAEPDARGYLTIHRLWKPGDVIAIELPMPVRRVLANDRVDANRGRVALQRGPLVYCIEAIDHDGQRTDAIVLPDDAELKAGWREDLLGGLTVITAQAMIAAEPAWGEAPKLRPLQLTAIPYHAWANRGDGYMDLWLARSADHATPLPAETAIHAASLSASTETPPKALAALRDGRCGPSSDHRATPNFAWTNTAEGHGWLECKWSDPRELSRSAIYWAVDRRAQVYWGERIRGIDHSLPESWKITYFDGSQWQPVETEEAYTLRLDMPNGIRFKPIRTTALRLEVEFSGTPAAVQEWWID